MAVTKVIQLPPQISYMVTSSVQVNTFQRRLTLAFAQVDEKGEQVRGGSEVTDTLTEADFDELVALMLPTFLPAAIKKMAERGTLPTGSTIVDAQASR